MSVVLVPSGLAWLDAEIGGFPSAGVVAVAGEAGTGKSSLALGFALAALKRGPTCFLTSDTPDAVLETSGTMLEHDLRYDIAAGRLSLLAFTPFFVNKVRSLNSVEAPLAELGEYFAERRIQHVIFDTLDPMLSWIDDAVATATVRTIVGQMQSWGITLLCTTSGTSAAALELARTAGGSLELSTGKLKVKQAGWCNVYGIEASVQFLQGRGLAAQSKKPDARSEERPVDSIAMPVQGAASPKPSAAQAHLWTSMLGTAPKPPGAAAPAKSHPWTSLIGDPNKPRGGAPIESPVIIVAPEPAPQHAPPVQHAPPAAHHAPPPAHHAPPPAQHAPPAARQAHPAARAATQAYPAQMMGNPHAAPRGRGLPALDNRRDRDEPPPSDMPTMISPSLADDEEQAPNSHTVIMVEAPKRNR